MQKHNLTERQGTTKHGLNIEKRGLAPYMQHMVFRWQWEAAKSICLAAKATKEHKPARSLAVVLYALSTMLLTCGSVSEKVFWQSHGWVLT